MGRLRFSGEMVLSDVKNGPIRAVWTAHGAALALFDQRTRNDLMRDSCQEGGDYWTITFLLKRFDYAYAESLGYTAGGKYETRKRQLAARGVIERADLPLVFTGVLRQKAMRGVTVTTTATANRQRIVIRIPTGHAVAPIVSVVLRALPAWEVARIAERIEKALVTRLQGKLEERMTMPEVPDGRPRASAPGRDRYGRFLGRERAA